MRVLHAAAELYPLVKTGGLGDVLGALPPALAAEGIDARLLLPGFPAVLAGLNDLQPVTRLPAPGWAGTAVLRRGTLPQTEVEVYAIDVPALYEGRAHIYCGPDGLDWLDNHRRFALLGITAARLAAGLDGEWRPDVVHAHDWHAALAPAYLRAAGKPAASVLTIHNLAFQGLFPPQIFPELELPSNFFAIDGLEFWGRLSFLKGGLVFADAITTVSPTYAREILTPEHGMGLDGVLRERQAALTGILNGVDHAIWDPAHDPLLAAPYAATDPAPKAICKAAIQRETGLAPDADALLLGAVTRLTGQKGFDLVLDAAEALIGMGCQIVMLGSGEAALEQGFLRLATKRPDRISVRLGYDEALAHRIYGGADALLVPSRFEPCGLSQLYAMRYGTLPIVRRTGGLADTVHDPRTTGGNAGTGFVFDSVDPDALIGAVTRATLLRRDSAAWQAAMRRAMTADFGWGRAAAAYARLYRSLPPGRD